MEESEGWRAHPCDQVTGHSAHLENRNQKREKRKAPPFIPQEQRDGAEIQNPQGWATQRRFSELRRGHPPRRLPLLAVRDFGRKPKPPGRKALPGAPGQRWLPKKEFVFCQSKYC